MEQWKLQSLFSLRNVKLDNFSNSPDSAQVGEGPLFERAQLSAPKTIEVSSFWKFREFEQANLKNKQVRIPPTPHPPTPPTPVTMNALWKGSRVSPHPRLD